MLLKLQMKFFIANDIFLYKLKTSMKALEVIKTYSAILMFELIVWIRWE